MSDVKSFDVGAARKEYRQLRRRAKELEREIAAHLREQLRALLMTLSATRDTETLVTDVRKFLDQDDAA